jgi:hypothetical protein
MPTSRQDNLNNLVRFTHSAAAIDEDTRKLNKQRETFRFAGLKGFELRHLTATISDCTAG